MHDFQVLFDHGERSELLEPAMAPYGKLGFPAPPVGRPWIYANFVQSLDGIVSLGGDEAGGADISQLAEDRWLMDLLRAHADAVMVGMGTLREERRLGRPRPRGPVFRIVDPVMQELRVKIRPNRQRNVLVSSQADFQMSDYAVFDGEYVDVTVLTTHEGAQRLEQQPHHASVEIVAVNELSGGRGLDLAQAVTILHERYGVRYLLCEGGPKLYSAMLCSGLIDEKFITVSPIEVGQKGPHGLRPTLLPDVGFTKENAVRWNWLSCRKLGDYQFQRFRRRVSGIC
jgi:riboflavin biosynthesis pyrimidine reductase